jgi:hypothetical protein
MKEKECEMLIHKWMCKDHPQFVNLSHICMCRARNCVSFSEICCQIPSAVVVTWHGSLSGFKSMTWVGGVCAVTHLHVWRTYQLMNCHSTSSNAPVGYKKSVVNLTSAVIKFLFPLSPFCFSLSLPCIFIIPYFFPHYVCWLFSCHVMCSNLFNCFSDCKYGLLIGDNDQGCLGDNYCPLSVCVQAQ